MGRSKKKPSMQKAEEAGNPPQPPRKRGRPKKIVQINVEQPQQQGEEEEEEEEIEQMQANASRPKKHGESSSSSRPKEEEEEEEEVEEIAPADPSKLAAPKAAKKREGISRRKSEPRRAAE